MAVIKCSNCENEILDSEIVCPYCDCPVSITKDKINKAAPSAADSDGKSTMKIASREDFEKEKAALMTKLADEEKNLSNISSEAEGKTVRISKNDMNVGKERDTDRIPVRDVKAKASRINISTPGEEKSSSSRSSSARQSRKSKEKGKKLILAVTFIGVLLIVYLIFALFSNIQDNMSSLKKKENKSSVVSSDAEVVDKGFKFSSSSTLIITSNDVMEDYDSASSTPWADKANQIKHITIEDSVERIGDYAFAHFTALEDVVLGKSVAEIGKEAFYGCESLERVTCRSDSKLRTIKENAFTNCSSLESFKLGSSIKSIGDEAFKSCISLEEIEIPSNVKIGDDAFFGCSSDFTILCKENSSAHDYADENGLKVEFTNKNSDDEDDTDDDDIYTGGYYTDTDSDKKDNKSTSGTDKKDDTKKDDDKKDDDKKDDDKKDGDKDSDDNTGKTNTDGDSESDTDKDNSGGKSQSDIMSEIADTNSKLKDPSLTADEKAALEAERDKLSVELKDVAE